MNGNASDALFVRADAEGQPRTQHCNQCGRSQIDKVVQKRCGECFDQGKTFLVECCDLCGGMAELDKLMKEHDTAQHPPVLPAVPIVPGKTAEEWQSTFQEMFPVHDSLLMGTNSNGRPVLPRGGATVLAAQEPEEDLFLTARGVRGLVTAKATKHRRPEEDEALVLASEVSGIPLRPSRR